LSKKTGKDTFVKKTLTCETAAAPLCHKAIKKTKRVSFNPSTGLALSPSKKTLAPRKPTVRYYSIVKKKKKNWTVILKISHRVNRGPFSRTTRQ
jgi:hypothetical protein